MNQPRMNEDPTQLRNSDISSNQVQSRVLNPEASCRSKAMTNMHTFCRVEGDNGTGTRNLRWCSIAVNHLEIIPKDQSNKNHLDQRIRKVLSGARMSSSTKLCYAVVDGGKLVSIYVR